MTIILLEKNSVNLFSVNKITVGKETFLF